MRTGWITAQVARVLAVTILGQASAALADGEAYERAVYDYRVAVFCSLVGDEVRDGFRIEAQYLIARDRLSAMTARSARQAAAAAVDRKWRNRGSGARDPRCRTAGRAAADRFRSFLLADEP